MAPSAPELPGNAGPGRTNVVRLDADVTWTEYRREIEDGDDGY